MPLIAAAAPPPPPAPVPVPVAVADGYGISIGGLVLHQVDGRLAVRMPDGSDHVISVEPA